MEVWFDQSELVGGDAWDAKIRKQIKDCALLIPVISANTQARSEGYFRLEWRLAVERARLMADDHPFLFPVVIDDTPEALARVPDKFRDVQWTRLSVKDTPAMLAARVGKLLGGTVEQSSAAEAGGQTSQAGGGARRRDKANSWVRVVVPIAGVLFGLIFMFRSAWSPAKHSETKPSAVAAAPSMTEAQKLVAQARTLTDDALNATRENYQLAEDLVQKALVLDAGDASSWALAATISGQMIFRNYDVTPRRLELVRNQAERATRLDPQSLEAGVAMVYALTASREFDEAWSRLQPLLQRAPNDRATLRQAAAVARRSGREKEAADMVARLEALPGGDPIGLFAEAHYLSNRGQFGESGIILDRLLATAPARLVYSLWV